MASNEKQSKLPILDLSRFDQGPEARAAFCDELGRAAHEVGFFYLVGHGISDALIATVQSESRRFFALPEAEKLAIEMVNSPHFRGYTRVGAEFTRGRPDWREQIDIGAERPVIPAGPGVPAWARLQGPNQWPDAVPGLKPALLQWQDQVGAMLIRVLRAFALALGQNEDAFAPIYGDAPHHLLKIIRYPGRVAGRDDQGVGAHNDSGILTALLQDDVGGLQVQTADGWIDATPIPGAFIINIGESLELAAEGYLRSTVHRVIAPPEGVDRISIAYFLGPRLDAEIPLLRLPPHLAARVKVREPDPNNPLFRQSGQNYLKGRLRSHPDVARRHHPDLLADFGLSADGPGTAY